jgi:CheY-like chemotaxis protein
VPDRSRLDSQRVLLVDDDADGRDMVKTVLEQWGAVVAMASSVAEALVAFERDVPDLLVSDLGMPGRDGYDLIREIRGRTPEAGGRIPAIALTAFAAPEEQKKVRAAGFDDYLAKPADPMALVSRVARLARHR